MTIIDARARFREKQRHRDFEIARPRMTCQYPRRWEDAFIFPVPTYDDDIITETLAPLYGVTDSP